jgi:hypothetical protein
LWPNFVAHQLRDSGKLVVVDRFPDHRAEVAYLTVGLFAASLLAIEKFLNTPAQNWNAGSSFSLYYDPALYLNDEGVREATGAAWSCVTEAESTFAGIRSNLPWEIVAEQLSRLHREVKDSEYAIETIYDDFAECGLRIQVGGVDEISAHAAALALAKWVLHEVWTAATEPERWLESEFELIAIGNNYPAVVNHFVSFPPLDTTELKTLLKQEAILAAKARRTKYAMRPTQAPTSLITKTSGLTHLDLPSIFRCAVELAEAAALVAPSEWAHEPMDIEGPASPHFGRWMERHRHLSRIEEECGRLKRSLGATGLQGITDISAVADIGQDGESPKWESYDQRFSNTAHDRIVRLALLKLSTAAIDLSGFATWREPQWAMREKGLRLLIWGLAQLWEGMSAEERSRVQDCLQRTYIAVGWPSDSATEPASYNGPEEIPLEDQYRLVTNYVACCPGYTDDVQKAVHARAKQEQEKFLRRATLGQFVQLAEPTAKALQAMAKRDFDTPAEFSDLHMKAFGALTVLRRAKEVPPRGNWPNDALEQRHLLAEAAGLLLVCIGASAEAQASLKPEDAEKALEDFTRATDRLAELAKTEGNETDRKATGNPMPDTSKIVAGTEQELDAVREFDQAPKNKRIGAISLPANFGEASQAVERWVSHLTDARRCFLEAECTDHKGQRVFRWDKIQAGYGYLFQIKIGLGHYGELLSGARKQLARAAGGKIVLGDNVYDSAHEAVTETAKQAVTSLIHEARISEQHPSEGWHRRMIEQVLKQGGPTEINYEAVIARITLERERLLPAERKATVGTASPGEIEGLSWQEVAKRLERLRSQGEPFTSQHRLAEQLSCSSGTINKAIRNTPSLRKWAKKPEPIPKVRSLTPLGKTGYLDVVTDSTPQTMELDPVDEVAIREFVEKADPETRAWFLALSREKQLDFLNDPDKYQKILGRKP